MWKKARALFAPPVFEDEDKTRIANLLNTVVWIIFLIALIRTIAIKWAPREYTEAILLINTVLITVIFLVVFIMHRGYVKEACILFTVVQWLITAHTVIYFGSITISVYSFFIFVILSAGLLLGGRWAVAYALMSIVFGTIFFILEERGIVTAMMPEKPFHAYNILTPSFIMTAVFVYLYHRDIINALKNSRENAQRIAIANEQLNREITMRKRLEEKMLQSQKMEALGKLAGGIAHDFNNLLLPILGYVDLNLSKIDDNSKLYSDLLMIRKAAERSAKLTDQILAFSRQKILKPEILDLNGVIVDFEKMISKLIGEKIETQLHLSTPIYRIKADKGQIEQVLMNLIPNARDAMPEGGKLIIETANVDLDENYVQKYAGELMPGAYVMLSISDTGCGMDAEIRKRIFDPFFTTKEAGKGTGLGLATTYGIIKQHKGTIQVYSEPDHGTTFKIYLPRTEDIMQNDNIKTETIKPLEGNETILVAEDEKMVREFICESLRAYGYDVIEAYSLDECAAIASEKETIHLLISDVIMPEANGKDFFEKVTQIHPQCKVLYMSGYTTNVVVHHGGFLDEGINFLQKPFTVNQLIQKLREILDHKE